MLSSQISLVSQTSKSHLLLNSSTTMLRSTTIWPGKAPRQQVRTLRFGLWSSYLDPSFEKELHRRHRAMQRKYMDACSRKQTWNRPNQTTGRQLGSKEYICTTWRGRDSRPGAGRWMNIEELNSALKDVQARFSQATMTSTGSFSTTRSRENVSRDQPDANSEPEYDIDPITNKKVYRKPSESFEGYRARFQGSQPQPNDWSVQSDPTREVLKEFETAESHQPYFAYEPDGKIPDQVQEEPKDFDSTQDYKPYFAYEPDGKMPEIPDHVQQSLKEFETVEMYKPFFAYEPDGKIPDQSPGEAKSSETDRTYTSNESIPDPVQKGLKDYESDKSYEPYFAYEPDGKIPNPVEDGLKEYETGKSYEPYFAYEPDGKIEEEISNPVDEGLKEYDTGVSYNPFFAYEPDGKIEEEISNPVEEGLKEYDTGKSYGPYFAYEPDGKIPGSETNGPVSSHSCPVQDGLKDYDSKASYGPVMYNRPDGIFVDRSDPVQKGLEDYDSRVSYAAHPTEEHTDKPAPESIGKNGPQTSAPNSEVDAWGYDKTPQGLELSYEQEVQNSEKEFIDGLASATSFSSKPDTPRIQTSLDRTSAAADASDNPDEEVRQIRARYSQDKGAPEDRKLQNEMDPYSKAPQGLETQFAEERRLEIEKDPYSKKPQGLETHFQEERKLEIEKDPYSKEPQGLETHFQEERKLGHEIDPYSKKPQGLETSYVEECAAQQGDAQNAATEGDILSEHMARSQNNRDEKMLKQQHKDLVREVRSIYEDKYGKIDSQHRQVPEATNDSQPAATQEVEPTMYKILAYDPVRQQISTAETSSTVPDNASPITPSEALILLQNGAKFIPYFSDLEAQGYEIASAGNNTLVFRKVRPAKTSTYLDRSKATNPIDGMRGTPIAATGNFASPTGFVNHDLPGDSDHQYKPNSTVHREEDVFSGRSNWSKDSRRRGRRNGKSRWAEDGKPRRRKMGTAKKMILGAAWLGGLSYTFGVVAQYFKTGGVDGLGPQGF